MILGDQERVTDHLKDRDSIQLKANTTKSYRIQTAHTSQANPTISVGDAIFEFTTILESNEPITFKRYKEFYK